MNYDWIKNISSPKVIAEAVRLLGTKEIAGAQHNPVILEWAKEIGVDGVYKADEIPWCGLFVGVVIKNAGFVGVKTPLWAKSWNEFGSKQDTAMLGDILVFTRDGGGHVGFYVGEDDTCYHVLGGNQGDQVSVVRINKQRAIGIRRCIWKIKQPDAVRVIKLSPAGAMSTNEK